MTLPVIIDRTIKPYVLILASIFVTSFLAGTIAPTLFQKEAAEASRFIAGMFKGLSGGWLFYNILVHNVIASILILLSGVLFGIVPIFSMGTNGFFLGVIYRHAAELAGYSKAAIMILPHGVFVIPALLLAASYGLWLGVMTVQRMRGKESTLLRFQIEHAFRRYFAVVFPLLVVAAAIETALILKIG